MPRLKLVAAITLWLFLVVSSLIVACTAFHYLGKEEERIAQLEQQAVAQRLDAVVTDLELVLGEIRLGLEDGLRSIPPGSNGPVLDQWVEGNPFASAGFQMRPDGSLQVHPAVDDALLQALSQALAPHPLREARQAGSGRRSSFGSLQAAPVEAPRNISQRQQIRDVQQRSNTIAAAVVEEEFAAAAESTVGEDVSARPKRAFPAAKVAVPAAAMRPVEWIWVDAPAPVLVGYMVPGEPRGLARGVIADRDALFRQLQAALPAGGPFTLSAAYDSAASKFGRSGNRGSYVSQAPATREVAAVPGLSLFYNPTQGALGPESRIGLFVSLMLVLLTVATLLAATLLLLHSLTSMRQARQRTGFVSTVSHEFKTPLTTIRMYAEMLREGRINNPEKREAYLSTIESETGRLSRMVGNVLNFSRVERGASINYNMQRLDLGALLGSLADEQRPRIGQAGMELQLTLPADKVLVTADRDSVCQILLNLMDNAIRYAPSGAYLGIRLETAGDVLRLLVEDRGPGIPRRMRSRLFKPFQRIDRAITDTRSGCGLGLSISRQIARDHGGDLELVPLEPGARFVLTLPLDQPQ